MSRWILSHIDRAVFKLSLVAGGNFLLIQSTLDFYWYAKTKTKKKQKCLEDAESSPSFGTEGTTCSGDPFLQLLNFLSQQPQLSFIHKCTDVISCRV